MMGTEGMSRWWRAYDEALHDPKLLALPDRLHRAWFNLLCIASKHGGALPAMSVVAIELRVTLHKAAEWVTALVVAGLVDKTETGAFVPHNWARRQFKSDVSTSRVKRFRERERNVSPTVSETPPETETEAETETESERKKEGARARADRYSSEFEEGVWKPYPRTPVMSKAEAWRAWQKASAEDRAAIVAAVPKYVAWLRSKPDHPAVHCCRFITQRRFDGFGEQPEPAALPPGKFHAKAESPELAAWDRWSRHTRGKPMLRDRAGGWLVDSQWPPEVEPPDPHVKSAHNPQGEGDNCATH